MVHQHHKELWCHRGDYLQAKGMFNLFLFHAIHSSLSTVPQALTVERTVVTFNAIPLDFRILSNVPKYHPWRDNASILMGTQNTIAYLRHWFKTVLSFFHQCLCCSLLSCQVERDSLTNRARLAIQPGCHSSLAWGSWSVDQSCLLHLWLFPLLNPSSEPFFSLVNHFINT